MYQAKRRKKRYAPGLRTVELMRGKTGYGFTITSQQPCMLSCIVEDSPADRAGLKVGDLLMAINGQDVSKALHDDVIRLVGSSAGLLLVQIAENYASSDSSDDDFMMKKPAKYGQRLKSRPYPAPQPPLMQHTVFNEFLYPPGPADNNHEPQGYSTKYPGYGYAPQRKNEGPMAYGRILQERNGPSQVTGRGQLYDMYQERKKGKQMSAAALEPARREGITKHTLITRDGRVIKSQSHSALPSDQSDTGSAGYTPRELSNILNPLIKPHVMSSSLGEDSDSELNDSMGPSLKAVVGYIGSVELPRDAHLPSTRVPSIRSAVRRLRMERKVHTMLQIEVFPDGVRLINSKGSTWARYPRESVAFAGVYPEDTRYFGIVTLQGMSSDELSSENSFEEYMPSSACHVFLVDPEMHKHVVHVQKARQFAAHCNPDPQTGTCRLFPRCATDVANNVARLYRDRDDRLFDTTASTASNQDGINNRSHSSSNSSHSDSGLGGFVAEMEQNRQPGQNVCVVNLPPHRQHSLGNLNHSQHSTPREKMGPPSSSKILKSSNASSKESLSNKDHQNDGGQYSTLERLNVRAMPDPKGFQRATSTQLAEQKSAPSLRKSIHKIIKNKQHPDQESSDNSSVKSNDSVQSSKHIPPSSDRDTSSNYGSLGRGTSAFSKFNSDSSILDVSRVSQSDGLIDKLSPRAIINEETTTAAVTFQKRLGGTAKAIPIPSVPDVKTATVKSTKLIPDSQEQTISDITPFKPPRPDRRPTAIRGRQKTPAKAPPDRPKSTPPLHLHKTAPRATISECESDFDEVDRLQSDLSEGEKKEQHMGDRRFSEGWVLLKKKDKVIQDLDCTMPEVKLSGLRIRPSLSSSHESLVVSEDYIRNQNKYVSSAGIQSVAQTSPEVEDDAEADNRVASWAVSFDRLLRDPEGLQVFTDFLKKEYSEENIIFWSKCEKYKKLTDNYERKKEAKAIFEGHLSAHASDPVNVDSNARREAEEDLDNPLSTQFNAAQSQIFQLMKTDSYSRFLKSDLYKAQMVAELEGKSGQTDIEQPKGKYKDNKKSMKKSKSIMGPHEEKPDEKRRKSLLPWKQGKGEKKVIKVSTEPDLHRVGNRENNNNEQNTEHVSNGNVVTKETYRLVRVLLPDTSTTVISARPGHTIRNTINKLFERRNVKVVAFDVFDDATDKILGIDSELAAVDCKEIRVEHRVVFRVDLPNKKSIGLRGRPEKTIADVLKPALHKYGHKFDEMVVHRAGSTVTLEPDTRLATINGQRIYVQSIEDFAVARKKKDWGTFGGRFGFNKPPVPRRPGQIPPYIGSTDDNTNQVFKELLDGKTEVVDCFDEEGILDPESLSKPEKSSNGGFMGFARRNSLTDKDKVKTGKTKTKPTPIPGTKPTARRGKDPEEERFIELLTRVQSHRLDDQRGLTAKDLELPDFLKTEDDDGSDVQSQRSSDTRSLQSADSQFADSQSVQSAGSCISGASSVPETAISSDNVLISEIFDQDNNDNGFFGDSLSMRGPTNRFVSPGGRSQISYVDKSFGGEGFVPTHLDAENYFSHCQSAHGLEENELPGNTQTRSTNYGKNKIPKAPPRKITVNEKNQNISVSKVNLKVNQTYVVKNTDGVVGNSLVLVGTPSLPSPPVAWNRSLDNLDMPNYSPPTPLNMANRRKSCDSSKAMPPSTLNLEDIDAYELIADNSPSTPSPTTHDLVFSPDSAPSSPTLHRPVPLPRRTKDTLDESGISRTLDYLEPGENVPVQYV